MEFFKKKGFYAFIFGTLFAVFIVSIVFTNLSEPFSFLVFPFQIGSYAGDIILWPICHFSKTDICRGLGLDGGPLVWIEWTSIIGGGLLMYGLIFLGVYKLYTVIRNKF